MVGNRGPRTESTQIDGRTKGVARDHSCDVGIERKSVEAMSISDSVFTHMIANPRRLRIPVHAWCSCIPGADFPRASDVDNN